jgi:hypothetical protein
MTPEGERSGLETNRFEEIPVVGETEGRERGGFGSIDVCRFCPEWPL